MENISDYIDEIKDKLTEACLPLGVSIKGIESPDKYTIIVNTSVGRACAATKQPVELKENKEFINRTVYHLVMYIKNHLVTKKEENESKISNLNHNAFKEIYKKNPTNEKKFNKYFDEFIEQQNNDKEEK
jgi:hypothetical protein